MNRSLLLFISAFALLASASSSASQFPDRYDRDIKQAAERFLPGVDWRLFKAQLYQESRLDPSAISPVGASGLAQFMPGTWADVSRSLGYNARASPHMAKPAIHAGAFYMAKLRLGWSAPRPEADRHSLAMASYNAGFGNLLKAQRIAGGANGYGPIAAQLPQVTGRHSKETITYVKRIWGYWMQMLTGTNR